jgi:hypothetical protein
LSCCFLVSSCLVVFLTCLCLVLSCHVLSCHVPNRGHAYGVLGL